jgi:hypothetical protein
VPGVRRNIVRLDASRVDGGSVRLRGGFRAPNGTVAKLRAALHATCDAARQLLRLTIALAEAICNCRDAVAQMSPRRGSAGPANRRFDSFSY